MNSQNRWDLQIDPCVVKTLKKIPVRYARRVFDVIDLLPSDPYVGDIQKIKGEHNVWRRRVGEYRLFYKIITERQIILVFHVERRTSSTY